MFATADHTSHWIWLCLVLVSSPARAAVCRLQTAVKLMPIVSAMHVCDRLCCAGAYQGATHRLVNQLQWDSILPCHGNYIPSGGKQILKEHLGLKLWNNNTFLKTSFQTTARLAASKGQMKACVWCCWGIGLSADTSNVRDIVCRSLLVKSDKPSSLRPQGSTLSHTHNELAVSDSSVLVLVSKCSKAIQRRRVDGDLLRPGDQTNGCNESFDLLQSVAS